MIRIELDNSIAKVSRVVSVERRAKGWRGWFRRTEAIEEPQLLGAYRLSPSSRVDVLSKLSSPGRLDVLLQGNALGHDLAVRFRTEDHMTPALDALSNKVWYMLGPRLSRWTMFKMRVRSYFLNRMGR